jgi:hypothetical protein
MVMTLRNSRARQRGALTTELVIAMAILVTGMLPLAFTIVHDQKAARRAYQQAVAMQIIDGEMELLRAGQWRAVPAGTNSYPITAAAARNLPPGEFRVVRTESLIRLEWKPQAGKGIRTVRREATLK